MTGVYVAIAALFCLFLGIAVSILAAFLWYCLKTIKELKASIDIQAIAAREFIGDGSIKRLSRAAGTIADEFPDMLKGIKEFSRVMSAFSKVALNQDELDKVAPPGPEPGGGEFYGYSDAEAAQGEKQAKAKADGLILTDEQLSHFRTDAESQGNPQES